jgi:hypothetical protein
METYSKVSKGEKGLDVRGAGEKINMRSQY